MLRVTGMETSLTSIKVISRFDSGSAGPSHFLPMSVAKNGLSLAGNPYWESKEVRKGKGGITYVHIRLSSTE